MRRSTLITTSAYEVFALVLLNVQALGGVRTDEAKYLLNIGYPHPPFVRFLMGMTDAWPFQEWLWRFVFATLLIQATWLAWDMARDLAPENRFLITGSWLLSASIILWTGALYLSTLAALTALVFLWAQTRPKLVARWPGAFSLLWLVGLFSSFQTVLFAPVVYQTLRPATKKRTLWIVSLPLVLLGLYVLSHPLIAAAFVHHGDVGAAVPLLNRFLSLLMLFGLAGSAVASILGLAGIVLAGVTPVGISFVLVLLYVTGSVANGFYAVLFTPLLVAGTQMFLGRRRQPHGKPFLAVLAAAAVVFVFLHLPSFHTSEARKSMQVLMPYTHSGGTLLINGSFGHEWQYESPLPVAHYVPLRLHQAKVVVCLQPCEPPLNAQSWRVVNSTPVEMWTRR